MTPANVLAAVPAPVTASTANIFATSPDAQPVRIWDLPTRVFRWLLVLCVLGLVITDDGVTRAAALALVAACIAAAVSVAMLAA